MSYETGSSSWVGVRVRKGARYGKVKSDYNHFRRILEIKMDNGSDAEIVMNNIGPDPDPEELAKWEWFCTHGEKKQWYHF